MATVIRVGSKAKPKQAAEEERPRRSRSNTGTDDDGPQEEPKRKTSTTIKLGSKARNNAEQEQDNVKEEKVDRDDEEEKRDTEQEKEEGGRRRRSSSTSIKLGSRRTPPKSVDEENPPPERERSEDVEPPKKASGTTITLGSKAKPLTNGDVSKQNDLSYEENYNRAKEMYGEPPPMNTKALPRMPKVKNKTESWPPTEAQSNEMFTVEGYGRTDPYTNKLIEKKPESPKHAQQTPHRDTTDYDPNRKKEQPEEPRYTNPALPHDERVEIDDGHVRPVAQLKRQWTYKPQPKVPGVNRPSTQVKDEDSWIKHIKAPVEYDKTPEEPAWKQLVRNRRWKSTIRARFPGKEAEVIEFERRSTTPKNWGRLLKDKKSVRMIGAITGIGPEGEELLWRLASRREKVDDTSQEYDRYQPREPSETLAYEHMKDNLEAAVYACLEGGGEREYFDDDCSDVGSIAETIPSIQSARGSRLSRSSSTASDSGSPKLRRRPPRLAPEEFKKQIALEKSRDATLRWQFSADPYDSVHENQLLPFELAVLHGEKDRRLRNLFRKLVKPEDMPDSAFSSPPGTPRRRAPYYDSEPEMDMDYYSSQYINSGQPSRQSRPKKRVPPPPPPRRGRSVSPSAYDRREESEDRRFTPQDLILSDDLRDEIKKLDQLSQQLKDDSDRNPTVHDTMARIEAGAMEKSGARYEKDAPEEIIKTGLQDRKKTFLKEAERQSVESERAQRTDDIDRREIRARRDRFVEQDRQSMDEGEPQDARPQKPRKKVQRIKSDAELHEVFRKRREVSDVNVVGDEPDQASGEMKNLVSNIQETFGDEGQRAPTGRRRSSIDIGELNQIQKEEVEYDADADDDNEGYVKV